MVTLKAFFTSFLITYSSITTYFIYSKGESPKEGKIIVEEVYEQGLDCSTSKRCKDLTQVIYFEGRGESTLGQIAIGHVVLNRVRSPHFPNTIHDVVYQPHQFSFIKEVEDKSYRNKSAYKKAQYISKMILLGLTDDPTKGATHYLNPKKLSKVPKWALKYPRTVIIGNHSFHKG